jgi:3-hydroxyisobutyrate dehydrogenase-like beta-hydroxyacid dehydrogenase
MNLDIFSEINSMSTYTIGFIGFGEVGSAFSAVLASKGVNVLLYDVLQEDPNGINILRKRISRPRIEISKLPDLVNQSNIILSTVTTDVALEAAQSVALYLRQQQTYIDLNSVSPETKMDIGQVIEETGADFVEGSILGAVGVSGAATRILLAGRHAQMAADTLNSIGLNAKYLSPDVGKASQFKMLRSIYSKGLEVLLLEMMVAAYTVGIEEELWNDIVHFMTVNAFEDVASNWIRTHGVAYKRRYHEMLQVLEEIKRLGIEPIMSSATLRFFFRSYDLKLEDHFKEQPSDPAEVYRFLAEKSIAPHQS